jgi:hypothetical protein
VSPSGRARRGGGQPRAERRIQVRPARGGLADGVEEDALGGLLEDEAGGAVGERPAGEGGVVLHGQDHHAGERAELRDGRQARRPAQVQVEHEHVGAMAADLAQRLLDVARLRHHLHVVLRAEDVAQPAAHDGVVVGEEDPDHGAEVLQDAEAAERLADRLAAEDGEPQLLLAPGLLARAAQDVRATSAGTTTTPSTSATTRSPGAIATPSTSTGTRGAEVQAAVDVQGEVPRAKTGKPSARTCSTSRQSPSVTRPAAPRATQDDDVSSPHTAAASERPVATTTTSPGRTAPSMASSRGRARRAPPRPARAPR